MFSLRRVLVLIRKEFRQYRRSREVMRMMLVAPMLQLMIYGYAVGTDLHDVPVDIIDRDRTSESRALEESITHVGFFRVRHLGSDPSELITSLDHGQAVLAVDIPRGYGRALARGEQAPIQILADGTDSSYSLLAMGYLSGAIRAHAAEVARHYRERHFPGRPTPELALEPRIWYNPGLSNVNYMIPGIIGLILTTMSMSLTSLAIVREREVGTLEQLSVTPLRGMELMLGKMVWPAVLGLISAGLIVIMALVWFHVPMKGSFLLLFVLCVGFMPSALGIGLFISTITRTQQQAQMANFFFNMPSIMLSGMAFPIANMPDWAQVLTYFIPLRYFLIIVRGIFLKGSGMVELLPETLSLVGLGLGLLLLGAAFFRKTA